MFDDFEKLEHSLTNHPPKDEDVIRRFEHLREAAKDLGREIFNSCPPSRERSLAITKLEETVMWAVKSIAVNQ